MQNCYRQTKSKSAIPLLALDNRQFSSWFKQQKASVQHWIKANNFEAKKNQYCLLAKANGQLQRVLVGAENLNDIHLFADLPFKLPAADYYIQNDFSSEQLTQLAIMWGLGAYQFTSYKAAKAQRAKLVLDKHYDKNYISNAVAASYLVRDLVNAPTEDMGPEQLAAAAEKLAKTHQAKYQTIVGEALLKQNYPAIHTVGRASHRAPRLIDLTWGSVKHPRLTLVGKGVCFDSGGLDIKTNSGMSLMKKDMGGAAHVLALAQMIMMAKLPVRLRVLIGAVENSISGNAYRPGDVITMRSGKTVEVSNTDAEGRLVLADALAEASSERPDLLIDMATLTGAAKVATGPDLPAMFAKNDDTAAAVLQAGLAEQDPVWRLPLHQAYFEYLDSYIADCKNAATLPYAGAITAALFLQQFVSNTIDWLHFDIMAWNLYPRPGHPQGGEAVALRALFHYLSLRYVNE